MVSFLVSCSSEAVLEPSLADTDRVATQIDLSKPLVKRLYDDLNIGLLYEFNPVMDFAYAAGSAASASKWGDIELTQMKSSFLDADGNLPSTSVVAYRAYVDQLLAYVDANLFQYIHKTELNAQFLPYKILLCDDIYTPTAIPSSVFSDSESRIGVTIIGSLHSVFNIHSLAINLNPANVAANKTKFRNDNFYIFLCKFLEVHDLYSKVPEAFYSAKTSYYGKVMEAIYRTEKNIDATKLVHVIDKPWFYSKGFVDSKYIVNYPIGLSNYVQRTNEDGVTISPSITHVNAIRPSYTFVAGIKVDVRSYLDVMIHRNGAEINAYPETVKVNMRLLITMLNDYGVDIRGFNPALDVLY